MDKAGMRKDVWAGLGAVGTALAGSACCWLPLVLLALGAGTATIGGVVGAIEKYRALFGVAAVALLGVAFYLTYFKRRRPGEATCSCCGRNGKRVSSSTVRALVAESLRNQVLEGQYVLCMNPVCAQVYTAPAGGQSFAKTDLTVRVGFKEQAAPHLVCYCFEHSIEDIEAQLRAGGTTSIPDRIRAEIKAGRCACDVKNPQGTCCLGDVNRAVKVAGDRIAGRPTAPNPDLVEKHDDCWGLTSAKPAGGRIVSVNRFLLPIVGALALAMTFFPHVVFSLFSPAAEPAISDGVAIDVPGMTWPQSCPPRVRAALEAVPGVVRVDVDFESRRATVAIDPGRTRREALVEALDAAGFPHSTLKDSSMVIKVDGMTKEEGGRTWMAWPEAVKRALEGLEGVTKVEMDVDHDLFRVTRSNGGPSEAVLFETIRSLGYEAIRVDPASFSVSEPLHPVGELPELVRKAVERAKAESKRFILVDCTGDHWPACDAMSGRTFADPEVKKLIDEHFVFVELNVAHEKEAAGWFAGKGIPDTWVLDLEGRMRDRILGYMDAREFAERLRRLLER